MRLRMGTDISPVRDDFVTALLSAEMIAALDRYIVRKPPARVGQMPSERHARSGASTGVIWNRSVQPTDAK